jgi:hypothetical protein
LVAKNGAKTPAQNIVHDNVLAKGTLCLLDGPGNLPWASLSSEKNCDSSLKI